MIRKQLTAACTVAMFICVASANANIISLEAELDGLQVVPPTVSPATGLADVTLDDVSGLFTVTTGSYQGLLSPSIGVSLNDAIQGSNGLTILSLTLDSPGATTGTFSGSGTLTASRVTDVLGAKGYIMIRSSDFSAGEIRGQLFVVPTPEPSSIVLAAVGLAGLAAWRWRRKRCPS